MLTKTQFFLPFLLLSVVLPKAQNPCLPDLNLLLYLDRSSGLASSRVNAVTQDHLGFWWLGSEAGLQRFNGQSFHTFRHRPGDSTSLPIDGVIALHSDKKNRLWVASKIGIYRYLPESGGFKPYRIQNMNVSLGYPSIFLEDSQGDLWLVSTREKGLFRLRAGSDSWEFCSIPPGYSIFARNAWEDPRTGNIWLMYRTFNKESRIGYYDRKSGKLIPGPPQLDSLVREACHFVFDKQQKVWSSRISKSWQPEYLFKYDIAKGNSQRFSIQSLPFSSLFMDKKGRIWYFFIEQKQFGFIDPKTNQVTAFCWPMKKDGKTPISIAFNNVFEDREGNYWISTLEEVIVFNPFTPKFSPVIERADGAIVSKIKNPLSIWQSPSGDIWVGTYGFGSYLLDPNFRLKKKMVIPDPAVLDQPIPVADQPYNTLWCFIDDEFGNIWAGGQMGVLAKFSSSGELLWKGNDPALDAQTIRSIARDSDGYIWVGTQRGLLASIDPKSMRITRVEGTSPYSKKSSRLYQIIPDKGNWLWLVYTDQILYYNTRTKAWRLVRFSKEKAIAPGRQYDFFSGMLEWGRDSLLVYGTSLYWLDKKSKTLWDAKHSEKLPSRYVRSVIRTGEELLLCFTEGIVRWSPSTGKTVAYDTRDGLPDNFSEVVNVATRLPDGRIAVGMDSEGVYFFHPDRIKEADKRPSNVLIDGLWVKGEHVFLNLNEPLKNLRLRHSENFLKVTYASTSIRQQHHLRFRYRLKGYSRDWVENGTKRSIELTGLSPGRYLLEIQVNNREGLKASKAAQMFIRVLPPWYLGWPALLMYAFLLTFGIFHLYRFQLRRRLEMVESARLREIDVFKTKFYTNITHEFRTPLTIILSMAEQVKENPKMPNQKGMEMIIQNGNRLLELVNQVLELSKLESGHLELRLQRGDVILFLKYLTESYGSFAASQGIGLRFTSGLDRLEMDFDAEKVQQTLGNLLSNAIKFTPPGGSIEVEVSCHNAGGTDVPRELWRQTSSERVLSIKVIDTGIGIAPEEQKRVFDRFYQVHNSSGDAGTGIGLTLALELARWMKGEITVESEIGKGTTFTFYLPVLHQPDTPAFQNWTFRSIKKGYNPKEISNPQTSNQARKPRLLLVEDSPEVLEVLYLGLQKEYQIETAINGRIGLEKARSILPDLIISDVMMPELDGKALCVKLKQDIYTSHIPIILLTARAGMQNKLEGLNLGADDYLVKPFEKAELLARVRQLLEQRKRLQAYYLKQALDASLEPEDEPISVHSETERDFLNKVREIVESRLSDTDFSTYDLEIAMAMSHAQFYRKFTALMGISATEYLRRMRLQKAKELLKNPELSIAEVAYAVGYSDPAYFSKVFKSDIGVSPNEWRK